VRFSCRVLVVLVPMTLAALVLPAFATAMIVEGTVFEDLDADGALDAGEPGISGVRVYVDANDSDSFEAGEPRDTTDGSGVYSIHGVPADPSPRMVREVPPAGFECSYPSSLFADCEHSVAGTSGTVSGQDFGDFRRASISGTAFNDRKDDGTRDPGDPALANVIVYLDANGNDEEDQGEAAVATGADGDWSFGGLLPGTYTVREVAPAGAVCTAPSSDLAGCEFTEELSSGESSGAGHEFGNFSAFAPPVVGPAGDAGDPRPPSRSRASCIGREATIVGTPGPDTLVGTPAGDVIVAGDGDDLLVGLGANDLVCGEGGNDVLSGGGGADVLIGGPGRDRLRGGKSGDICIGGGARDGARSCEKERSVP
jgi:hypothetical protein